MQLFAWYEVRLYQLFFVLQNLQLLVTTSVFRCSKKAKIIFSKKCYNTEKISFSSENSRQFVTFFGLVFYLKWRKQQTNLKK